MLVIESCLTRPEEPGIYLLGSDEEHADLNRRLIPAALGAAATGNITLPEVEALIAHISDEKRLHLVTEDRPHYWASRVPNALKMAIARVLGGAERHLANRQDAVIRQGVQARITSAQLEEESELIVRVRNSGPTLRYITQEGVEADERSLAHGAFLPATSTAFPNDTIEFVAKEFGATHCVKAYELLQADGELPQFLTPMQHYQLGVLDEHDAFVPMATLLKEGHPV